MSASPDFAGRHTIQLSFRGLADRDTHLTMVRKHGKALPIPSPAGGWSATKGRLMSGESDLRPGEMALELPAAYDAGVYFIGRIRTPFKSRSDCPKSPAQSNAIGRVELDPRYAAALADLALYSHVLLLYWMDRARRDLIRQAPAHLDHPRGTFALRSPARPNPIALAAVELIGIEATTLSVRKIDCIDGTPLIDIKPYFASIDSFPHARRP